MLMSAAGCAYATHVKRQCPEASSGKDENHPCGRVESCPCSHWHGKGFFFSRSEVSLRHLPLTCCAFPPLRMDFSSACSSAL